MPNLTEQCRLWSDTGATSDSDGVPCVEPRLSSTKVPQTLSNLTLLPHQLTLPYRIDSDAALLPYLIHQLDSAHEWSGVITGPKIVNEWNGHLEIF